MTDYRRNRPLNPVHAILLGFPVSLFTGALLADLAYWWTAEAQCVHLALWLIAGGLLPGGLVLLWVFAGLVRAGSQRLVRSILYFAALLGMCGLGIINTAVHAKGGEAVLPLGLALSAATWALAVAAALIGYTGVPRETGE